MPDNICNHFSYIILFNIYSHPAKHTTAPSFTHEENPGLKLEPTTVTQLGYFKART